MSQEQPPIHLIVNPTAGRGMAMKLLPKIEKTLLGLGCVHQITMTRHSGHAFQIASESLAGGTKTVVSVGGDGTLHEVSNALLDSGREADASLGILATGTGNDFARCVGLLGSVEHMCEVLVNGKRHLVDLGVIEGADLPKRRFLVAAGAGYVADTAKTVNEGVRYVSGMPAYLIGALQTLLKFKPSKMTITLDDSKPRTLEAMLISVSNVATTGGGMKITAGAVCDDGLFEICLVHSVSKWVLLQQLPNVIQGTHVSHPAVEMLAARSLVLECNVPIDLWIDGEIAGTTPASFSMEPSRLPVLLPK